jgi:hypothetical protein
MWPYIGHGELAVLSDDDIAGIRSIYVGESSLQIKVAAARSRLKTFTVAGGGKTKYDWDFGDGVLLPQVARARHIFSKGLYYVTVKSGLISFGWIAVQIK